jgi:hypothetical protein
MNGMHLTHSNGWIRLIRLKATGRRISTLGETIRIYKSNSEAILTERSTRRCVNIVTISSTGSVINSVLKKLLFTYGSSLIGGCVNSMYFPGLEFFSYLTFASPLGGAGHCKD